MYLQIKKAELVKNQYWKNDIKITMVWLYDENWKRKKRVKLNDETLQTLLSGKSFLTPNLLQDE
jgi:hypothetical protein